MYSIFTYIGVVEVGVSVGKYASPQRLGNSETTMESPKNSSNVGGAAHSWLVSACEKEAQEEHDSVLEWFSVNKRTEYLFVLLRVLPQKWIFCMFGFR